MCKSNKKNFTFPYNLDKPRIEMFLEEFKQYYGGFVNILCRINAVPRPKHLEMRVGGI